MSNEENILNSHSIQGSPTPYVPYPPTFSRSDPEPFHITIKIPKPLVVFDGSPDELAALVRDARRFRRMERAHAKAGEPDACWCTFDIQWAEWEPMVHIPLAEIADALPEVDG